MDRRGSREAYDIALEKYKGTKLSPSDIAKLTDQDLITKDHIRMVVIVNGVLAGKTWTQIAADMGMSRDMLYDLRHRVELWDFVNSLLDDQLLDIALVRERDDLNSAMKFRNQLLQALTPRRVRQKIEADAKVEFIYKVEEPDAESGDEV